MRIAVINPNTTTAMTEAIAAAARAVAGPGVEIIAVQARSGVPSVESHTDEALATIGVLHQVRRTPADAYVIACFGDTGIDAARELADGPVVGMTEAALSTASALAHRFSVVTMPTRTIAQSDRVVARLGLGARCRVRAVDVAVAEVANGAAAEYDAFLAESRLAVEQDHAEAIVLGCAGLTELVAPLSAALGVPVIDGVAAGVAFAQGLVAQGLRTSRQGAYGRVSPETLATEGLS